MTAPYYLAIQGNFILVGKEPDGDSVRFVAQNPDLYQQLHRAYRIKVSRDGSIQLRFEGIDAPELHYSNQAQPLGATARDALLSMMGFTNIQYAPSQPTRVVSADPPNIPGTILTQAAEAYGRPISYVFTQGDFTDGTWVEMDKNLLQQTLNAQMLQTGMVYYLGYTSTPLVHRQQLIAIAGEARSAGKGVWQEDTTGDFVLNTQSDIGPDGQLIFPKLFRRATDYFKAVDKGFSGNLQDWILSVSQTPSRDENDAVVLNNTTEVHLSDLLVQRNNHVIFQADLLDITFVEK